VVAKGARRERAQGEKRRETWEDGRILGSLKNRVINKKKNPQAKEGISEGRKRTFGILEDQEEKRTGMGSEP